MLTALLLPHMHTMFPAHLNLLYLITLIFSENSTNIEIPYNGLSYFLYWLIVSLDHA